jgi:hypothetical protein
MDGLRQLRRGVALVVAVAMLVVSMPIGAAQAALVSTEQLLTTGDGPAERARVMAFLERADVREQIVALGVDPNEAAARVQALSDAQVRQIAGQLDQLPAGQTAVGIIVGAILLVFLILLLTDLLGLTNVFPFVNHHK